jgi:hypothetical protein
MQGMTVAALHLESRCYCYLLAPLFVLGLRVAGAMACWQGHMLWGSLPLGDCEALALLACRVLGPASRGLGTARSKVGLKLCDRSSI